MITETLVPIGKEEIEWVRSKHAGIVKSARRILSEAMEIGQWFIEAEGRMGFKRGPAGRKSREWVLWASAHFPEIHLDTIGRYMRLAENRDFLERKFNQALEDDVTSSFPPSIEKALRALTQRDRQEQESHEPEQPLAEFEEPLLVLRDQLKNYAIGQFQLQYLEAQIRLRMKTAKLGRRQIRQAIEWATQEHMEIREIILKTFLG